MRSESYPAIIGVILVIVGQSSMIQGIVSISTSFLGGLPWVQFFNAQSGVFAMGAFFIAAGISVQVLGLVAIFLMRARQGSFRAAERIPQTA